MTDIHRVPDGMDPVRYARQFKGDQSAPLVIPIPPEMEQYRDDIRRFVAAMMYKLKVHRKKGRWNGKTMEDYIPLTEGELAELKEAIAQGNMVEVLLEAADLANMAMIIASISVERG